MNVVLLMTTYAPAGPIGEATVAAARYAMSTWDKRLIADGPVGLHVADDGSQCGDYATSLDTEPASLWTRGPVTFSRQERGGVGASMNAAIQANPDSLLLYVIDDWQLVADLDVRPWVSLLETDAAIGSVRLGPPHPVPGTVEMSPFGWVLRQDRYGFAFSLRPALYHPRFFAYHGPFLEGANVGDVEIDYAAKYNNNPGPDVVLALYSPFEWTFEVDGYPRPSLAGLAPDGKMIAVTCERGHTFEWPDTGTPSTCPYWLGKEYCEATVL